MQNKYLKNPDTRVDEDVPEQPAVVDAVETLQQQYQRADQYQVFYIFVIFVIFGILRSCATAAPGFLLPTFRKRNYIFPHTFVFWKFLVWGF